MGKMCMFASENFGWEMEQDSEMVMEYPEFVAVEHSVEEMNERIAATCEAMHAEFINSHNEMCDMMVAGYVECRDMIVEKREGEWKEEFEYVWEMKMNGSEGMEDTI